MKTKSIFKRYEFKCLITKEQKARLLQLFEQYVFGKLVFPRVEIKNSPPPGPDYCILE